MRRRRINAQGVQPDDLARLQVEMERLANLPMLPPNLPLARPPKDGRLELGDALFERQPTLGEFLRDIVQGSDGGLTDGQDGGERIGGGGAQVGDNPHQQPVENGRVLVGVVDAIRKAGGRLRQLFERYGIGFQVGSPGEVGCQSPTPSGESLSPGRGLPGDASPGGGA